MSGTLFEGDFVGRVTRAEIGYRNDKPLVRIEAEVGDGPYKGRRATFDGKFDEKNLPFTKRAMLAVGWKGVTIATFADDVTAANLQVSFVVEIATWEKDGKTRQWSAIRYFGGSQSLAAVPKDKVRDFDKWLAEVDAGGEAPKQNNSDLPF